MQYRHLGDVVSALHDNHLTDDDIPINVIREKKELLRRRVTLPTLSYLSNEDHSTWDGYIILR